HLPPSPLAWRTTTYRAGVPNEIAFFASMRPPHRYVEVLATVRAAISAVDSEATVWAAMTGAGSRAASLAGLAVGEAASRSIGAVAFYEDADSNVVFEMGMAAGMHVPMLVITPTPDVRVYDLGAVAARRLSLLALDTPALESSIAEWYLGLIDTMTATIQI